ncbi:hypothetical protein RHGRI_008353 [Rhododendron griersonianum]|uniref:KIB1-4 beta-propeller domain-containing protein n=1 Tax=Rhododendron griersonianum TaxID=479676 RepID=A0AAV6L0I9_9ERIC|nr:hypothetical protein RHGRI_008353 [Rhododendron griersonianum]
MVITLLNPFTGEAVSLPPLKDPYGLYEGYIDDDDLEDFIRKAIVLEGPPDGETEKTSRIAVFKLLQHPTGEAEATWVPINRLGNQALFVGDNHSLSVSTLEFPECLPNRIYYTQHFHSDCPGYVLKGIEEDSGIFNMEEESFQSCCIPDPHFGNNVLPLIWFVPNMRGTVSLCFQSTSCSGSGLMQSEFGKIKII